MEIIGNNMRIWWKEGFYDTPVEGGVEITESDWNDLLKGQSEGKVITTNNEGYPVAVDYVPTLQEALDNKIAEIWRYYESEDVKSFTINGVPEWLDDGSRTSLLSVANVMGEPEETDFWYGKPPQSVKLTKVELTDLLIRLEKYAKEVFSVAQTHIAALYELPATEDIEGYDFKVNYPERLSFNY